MKKLFFLCAFLFISMQIHAQLYVVNVEDCNDSGTSVVIFSPDGTYDVNNISCDANGTATVTEILNDIINSGYKITHINDYKSSDLINNDSGTTWVETFPVEKTTYYLAVPWTHVGLTEIDSSELDLRISPNPAKEYINVEVDFKSQPSELVLISEQGYIYFKKDISNILSGQEFTLDISNVPVGNYLVTVKDNTQ